LIDGIQTLWTSEIELFPIAVTIERFREFEKYGCFTFGLECSNANLSIEKEKEEMGNEMEMNVQEFTLPEAINFNYEELKAMIQERCDFYESAVYTEAEIKNAKADKAMLNKLKKALNDERIKREREYMQPFNDFKAKVNEIISIIDKPVLMIDSQVKAFEEKQKEAKKAEILAFYETLNAPEELNFELMFDSKWLNASANMKNIQEEITFGVDNFKANMDMLSKLPEFGFEAQQVYIRSLDLQTAISEANKLVEMARLKAEKEKAAAEAEAWEQAEREAQKIHDEEAQFATEIIADGVPTTRIAPERQWVYLQVNVSGTEMDALRDFMSLRNIEFVEI